MAHLVGPPNGIALKVTITAKTDEIVEAAKAMVFATAGMSEGG